MRGSSASNATALGTLLANNIAPTIGPVDFSAKAGQSIWLTHVQRPAEGTDSTGLSATRDFSVSVS